MNLGDVDPNRYVVRDNHNVPIWNGPDIYSTYKCKLNTVLRHPDRNVPIIENYAKMMHKIVSHTLRFLKLLYIHRFESNLTNNINETILQSIPLTEDLIKNTAKIICTPTNIGQGRVSDATRALRLMLNNFYAAHYAQTIQNGEVRPDYKNLSGPIDYMAIEVLTMYQNNIKTNFVKYLVLYVNCHRDKNNVFQDIDNNDMLSSGEKKTQKRQFYVLTNAIVKDILCTNRINGQYNYQSGFDIDLLDQMKVDALPNKQVANYMDDLKNFPLDYFHGMLVMMRFLDHRGYKVPNLFPQRTSRIPGHFRMDTKTMVLMLYPLQTNEVWNMNAYSLYVFARTDHRTKGQVLAKGFMKDHQDFLWHIFFKTEIKGLFHGYRVLDRPNIQNPFVDRHKTTFHHMIQTNGVAASIICVNKVAAGTSKPKSPKYSFVERHITQIGVAERVSLQNIPNFVAIDPNRSNDLLSCVKINKIDYNIADLNNDNDAKIQVLKNKKCFRHTQDHRRNHMKINRNRRILQKEKKNALDVYGVSIIKREAELSKFDKKRLIFASYQQYCYHKNKFDYLAGSFYERKTHRNRQFRAFGARQKLDTELINNFKKTMGPPATTVVFMGDWCDKRHQRFNEPVKGIGFRQVFRKAGYKVYLVDEFKTSKKCSECQAVNDNEGICEKFRYVKNPKPKSRLRRPIIECHGLVRCNTCLRLWNRDPNAASNIWVAANAAVYGNERPQYLRRTQNQNEMDIDN